MFMCACDEGEFSLERCGGARQEDALEMGELQTDEGGFCDDNSIDVFGEALLDRTA